MPNLPSLSHSDVRDWTKQRFYERGETYFQQDRIQRPRREGRTLKAECQGSRPDPYHLEVEFHDDGIARAECSCPVGGGGRCKHVVALLLTWVESPEAVSEQDPLTQTVEELSQETLARLVLDMVERHPDLERLVSLASTAPHESPDPEELRTQIESALQTALRNTDRYSAPEEAAEELEPFVTLGDDYADHGHRADATTVYCLLIEAIQDHYFEFRDRSGALSRQLTTCVKRLGTVLAETNADDLRERVLRTLFEVVVWDIDQGGRGLGDRARDIIEEQATLDERHLMGEWTRDALAERNRTEEEQRIISLGSSGAASDSRDWDQQALGRLLLNLQEHTLDDEEYLRIARETGCLTNLVARLLDLDRLSDALDAARGASDYELVRLAPIFETHDEGAALHDLALDRLDDDPHRRLVAWLRDYATEHDDLDRALDLSTRLFWTRTSLSAYKQARSVAQRMDRWDEVRSELHDQLREQGQYRLLTRIHLDNGDVEAALNAVAKINSTSRLSSGASLKMDVAEAAEDEYPEEAIELYRQRGRSLIADRGRGNYRQAAELFQRVKSLYEQHKPGVWDDVLDALYDDELHRLPAAQDEFEKAGLL
ncbi:MAG: SWIM zinc finger domain-containing protein [Salinibacter sp.]|uniref:SWIM zinc finger domain-containing protein n=1 Tax=Salinibacter sp. TaxID=2065818 RepID=UPI0035D52183